VSPVTMTDQWPKLLACSRIRPKTTAANCFIPAELVPPWRELTMHSGVHTCFMNPGMSRSSFLPRRAVISTDMTC
jgi:hypothetical protein